MRFKIYTGRAGFRVVAVGVADWYTRGFSFGILYAWIKFGEISNSGLVSSATEVDMILHGACFSLAFGYIHNFLSIISDLIMRMEDN